MVHERGLILQPGFRRSGVGFRFRDPLLNRVVFCGPNTNLEDSNFGKVINSQCNTQRQGQAHFAINF